MNPYECLGLSTACTQKDIKSRYLHRALKCHPARTVGDPESVALFVSLAQAFEVLSDPDRRARFDAGEVIPSSVKGLTDALAVFKSLGMEALEGNYVSPVLRIDLEISPEEAARGCRRQFRIASCPSPPAAADSSSSGMPRLVEVAIPAGIQDEQRILMRGEGTDDLVVVVRIKRGS